MNAVGQGTLLAGRYRLERRHSVTATMSLWRGTDTTLDRPVAVRIVSPDVAAETLDAARRAALVDDPRLVRLLDVARTPGATESATTTYIVSEWVDGKSLADLVDEDGPLPAEHVRMIIGESAQALTTAARAGLHHLALAPTSILLTREGSIKVQGLAVDAAAAGHEDLTGERAEREDAVGLVALLYAGLTGRWPMGADTVAGFEPAPMVSSVPVSPAHLVAGVPGDLDTLCTVTFGPSDDGPRSPTELAHQLKPWNRGLTPEPTPRRIVTAGDRPRAKTFPVHVPVDDPEPAPPEPQDPVATDESGLFTGVFATDPDITAHKATERRNRILLAAIGALVLVGLGLAIWAMGGSSPTSTSPGTETSAETAGPATGATPVIAEVRGFDPEGDGAEGNDPQLAVDGNLDTNWRTSRYNTAQFGNLKQGVGLLIKLEQNSSVHEVTVHSNGSGGAIEVRAANGPTLDGSQVLGSGPAGDLVVRPDAPVNTQYLIIWTTELPVTDGAYRAEIAEVTIK